MTKISSENQISIIFSFFQFFQFFSFFPFFFHFFFSFFHFFCHLPSITITRDYLYYLIDDFVNKATNVFISLDENGFGRDAGHRSRTVRENSYDETRVWLRLNFNLFEESIDKLRNKLKNSSSCKTIQLDNSDSLFVSSRSR